MTPLAIFLFVWLAPATLLLLGAVAIVTWDRIGRMRAGDSPPAVSGPAPNRLPNAANDEDRKAA